MLKKTDLETRLIATDQASKVIDKVADKLDDLEKQGDAAIEITADDKATPDIDRVADRLAALSDEDRKIVVTAQVADAEKDIARVLRSLARVEEMDDEEVRIRVDALDKAKGKLDRLQAQVRDLDGETVDVKVEASGIDGVLDKLGDLPGAIGAAGSAMAGLGPVAGAGALIAGAAALTTAFAETAVEAQVLADLTGATVTEASKLQNVWKTTGADINDLNDVILQMNGVLLNSPEIAKQLGINLNDGKDITERFAQVVDLVASSALNAADKAKLMSDLFGEEGVRQVAKLLAIIGPDGLNGALADAVGLTEEQAAEAQELNTQLIKMQAEWDKIKAQIALGILPIMSSYVTFAEDAVTALERARELLPDEVEGVFDPKHLQATIGGVGLVAEQLTLVRDLADAVFGKDGTFDTFGGGDFAGAAADSTLRLNRAIQALEKQPIDSATQSYIAQGEAIAGAEEDTKRFAEEVLNLAESYKRWGDAVNVTKLLLSQGPTIESAVAGAQAFQDQIFGLSRIAGQAEAAYDSLGTAIAENGFTFDLNTEKGRANQQTLEQLASSLIPGLAAAYANADGDLGAFRRNMDELGLKTFAQLRDETDLTDRQIREVLRRLGMFDGATYEAQFKLNQADDAQRKLDAILPMLETLNLAPDIERNISLAVLAGDPVAAVNAIQTGVDALPTPTVGLAPDIQGALDVVNRELVAAGLPPVELPVEPDLDGALRVINDELIARGYPPIVLPTKASQPTNVATVQTATQNELNRNPLTIPVRVGVVRGGRGGLILEDAGSPSTPWPGGIAAEKGPEILDRRWLATEPTYVPPGTHVTSRRQTARILRTRGTRGLRRYDSGGMVAGPTSLTVNVNAAVIGNQFEVARTVSRGLRDYVRLNGSRA